MDVDDRANMAEEGTVFRKPGRGSVDRPSISSIRTPKPIFYSERALRGHGCEECFLRELLIIWVGSFRPTEAERFSLSLARELKPGLVEVAAKPVGLRHPH